MWPSHTPPLKHSLAHFEVFCGHLASTGDVPNRKTRRWPHWPGKYHLELRALVFHLHPLPPREVFQMLLLACRLYPQTGSPRLLLSKTHASPVHQCWFSAGFTLSSQHPVQWLHRLRPRVAPLDQPLLHRVLFLCHHPFFIRGGWEDDVVQNTKRKEKKKSCSLYWMILTTATILLGTELVERETQDNCVGFF